ncbi:XrtA/PEP-CTERM system-associated ATPase [Pelomicrobium sp. G1]|uniref:XrtA/PEP-CTERM system-associated ATPase n=1 Tax=unclassified Pelomicrobium TaxID=2815318 RepID=UPI0021DF00F0|nr:MAG: ATPase [Burkholderiales bacterium]
MYEAFYGLKGKPFQLNPDPAFLYASRGHKSALAYLKYGMYQGEGFIVITGEIGTGKTTLIRSLLEQLDRQKVVAAQLVSTQLDAENLLRAVATAFGIPVKAPHKAELLAEIEAYLTALVPRHKRALLIVDEAQNLSPRAVEELRMLSNFQLGNHALLQSVLVGQPELREVMRSARMKQLRQRVIASYHLGPMDRQETQGYIEHRLARVGWVGDPQFDAEAMDEIYGATGGVPRRINTLCNRLLLAGYLAEKHVFRGEDVRAVTAEMKDEGGLDLAVSQDEGAPAPAEQGATRERAAPKAAAGAGQGSPADSLGPGEGLELAGGLGSSEGMDPVSLQQRLLRLERAMFTVLDLLSELVRKESSGAPGAKPAARQRERG